MLTTVPLFTEALSKATQIIPPMTRQPLLTNEAKKVSTSFEIHINIFEQAIASHRLIWNFALSESYLNEQNENK